MDGESIFRGGELVDGSVFSMRGYVPLQRSPLQGLVGREPIHSGARLLHLVRVDADLRHENESPLWWRGDMPIFFLYRIEFFCPLKICYYNNTTH